MKFKKLNRNDVSPQLKVEDYVGDKLIVTSLRSDGEVFRMLVGVERRGTGVIPRVGLTKREARRLAYAILKELDR